MKYLIILVACNLLIINNNDRNQQLIDLCVKNGKHIAPSYKTRNCVQFVDVILKESLNNKITPEITKQIYVETELSDIENRLNHKDSTIVAGLCWALTSHGLANWINYKNMAPGDLIQYWNDVGIYTNGHCGIIKSVDRNGFYLYSSHPDTDGFGVLYITKPEYSFIVRLK